MEFFDRQKPSKKVLSQVKRVQSEKETDMEKQCSNFKGFQILRQRIRLHGMSRSEFNDAEGVVIEPDIDGGRIKIKLDKGQPEALQHYPDGIRVKWENVEWLNRKPVHEVIFHYCMNVDEETGETLTLSQMQAKMRSVLHSYNSGLLPRNVRMLNADLRTNTDHMEPSESVQFLRNNISKLRDAYYSFSGYGPPINMIDSECLSLYEKLVADMLEHSHIWNRFFENIKNTVWCERSVGILNLYATVLRRRAEVLRESKDEQVFPTIFRCERVLNLGGKQLKRYKDSLMNPRFLEVAHANDAATFYLDQRCAMDLTYRYLLIKHNLLMQTGRGHNTNPSEVRFLCELELDPTSGFVDSLGQSGNRLVVLMTILGRPPSRKSLSMTTNAEISAAYKSMSKDYCKTDFSKLVTPNRMCGCCGYFEEEGIRMKRCGGCLIEFYCSPECQRTAWTNHQHVCNPSS